MSACSFLCIFFYVSFNLLDFFYVNTSLKLYSKWYSSSVLSGWKELADLIKNDVSARFNGH
uniref:Uncharacterized protein n=1 Tax=Tetranychus urticae TaxID=32264 RepID=T1KS13_TETUR